MNNGTIICRTLKNIRKKIADMNGLQYICEPCPHEDECITGTCKACELDLMMLERELEAKKARGEKVYVEEIMYCIS